MRRQVREARAGFGKATLICDYPAACSALGMQIHSTM